MSTSLFKNTIDIRAIQPRVNVGAVAGGVLGGVVFNIIVFYLVYRFCLKGRVRPLYQHVEYEALNDAETGGMDEEAGVFAEMERRRRDPSSKRWSKRTMETRWSSIRTESTRLSSLRFDRFSLKGLPPVPIILEREGESRG